MLIKTEDYTIDITSSEKVIVSGSLRLQSPDDYDHVFDKAYRDLESAELVYIVDFSSLTLLNSAGIGAIAQFILRARSRNLTLRFKGTNSIPWQKKSLYSLQKLWPDGKIEIDLV